MSRHRIEARSDSWPRPGSSVRKAVLFAWLAGISSWASACAPVEFWDKERLNTPLMAFGDSLGHINLLQKIYYSREGAVGGIGSNAGGGCGCAN